MIEKSDIKRMRKYRHLIAGLIYESIGYFTPMAALRALEAHRKKQPFYCEWYIDMVSKRVGSGTAWQRDDALYIQVNRDIIRSAIRKRHKLKTAYQNCLAIVDRNIGGQESIGASWF